MGITSREGRVARIAARSFAARVACWIVIAVGSLAIPAYAKGEAKTDAEIKQAIIRESIAAYPGTCACPYNTDRAGHRCGRRSAYSRPGGYSPVCYDNDVTKPMIEDWKKRQRSRDRSTPP